MQDILDRDTPFEDVMIVEEEDSDIEVGDLPESENNNYKIAEQELNLFISYKQKKFLPEIDRTKADVLYGVDVNGKAREIVVGPVLSRGANLPSGLNLANYFDDKGSFFNVLDFFSDHRGKFPTLWTVVQCEAAMRNFEVGCERFFSLSGYISAPRRTRLGVRTYDCTALLASNLPKLYVDKEWVAKEYLRRAKAKAGAWKPENTMAALKCWNLERILDAELHRAPTPPKLSLEELIGEEKEGVEVASVNGGNKAAASDDDDDDGENLC
jgi:hypothetical protein